MTPKSEEELCLDAAAEVARTRVAAQEQLGYTFRQMESLEEHITSLIGCASFLNALGPLMQNAVLASRQAFADLPVEERERTAHEMQGMLLSRKGEDE